MAELVARALTILNALSPTAKLALGVVTVLLVFQLLSSTGNKHKGKHLPPLIPYTVPFIGSMLDFGLRPINFMLESRKKYGDVFSFVFWGGRMTVLLGPEGNNFFFNMKLADANAEEAYKSLTVPVFGPDVVYDVENGILMEQKKFVKEALTTAAFQAYVGYIQEEVQGYLDEKWTKTSAREDIGHGIAELTIRTAARCLLGKNIRNKLDDTVADAYADLDRGFTPLNMLFTWLPLPYFINRDRAHVRLRQIFLDALQERKTNVDELDHDMMGSLMKCTYRDGTKLSESAVACIMIALLLAGQHTSSTTTSWLMLYLADDAKLQEDLLKEQVEALLGDPSAPTSNLPPLEFDHLKKLPLLEACIKEILRIRPPLIAAMRKVTRDVVFNGYTIPAGDTIIGSPCISQLDETLYPEPEKFDPYRFYKKADPGASAAGDNSEWTFADSYDTKGAKSSYLPFGAGRHRCIGEGFAYLQIKMIMSTIIRNFKFELPVDPVTKKRIFPDRDFTSLVVMPTKPTDIVYTRRT
ncbi:cytochrome P450 [Gonapodya prolifera JEL478]|uniref:Cytochrome P450 n=1 Tax=Gonapodya prolifera (strain JEL478) TaxID=1344416 RepID=A0A139AYS6_GONPJ|nr:cytochrome P450 [Gonapodya prolifera JEL478]|eukprot:KXS21615.1 cytochrome P450 [Gonapodya prolifera JEL478]